MDVTCDSDFLLAFPNSIGPIRAVERLNSKPWLTPMLDSIWPPNDPSPYLRAWASSIRVILLAGILDLHNPEDLAGLTKLPVSLVSLTLYITLKADIDVFAELTEAVANGEDPEALSDIVTEFVMNRFIADICFLDVLKIFGLHI
jgi:hypothetical protein